MHFIDGVFYFDKKNIPFDNMSASIHVLALLKKTRCFAIT